MDDERRREELGLERGIPVLELFEKLLLRNVDGVGVAGGDLGGGIGLVDGALGFGGEELAVAGRLGVALGDGGGDGVPAGAAVFDRSRGCVMTGAAALAVGGEAFGDLEAEEVGGGLGTGLGGRWGVVGCGARAHRSGFFVCERVELRGAHVFQTETHFP